jgi:hypothetical protein
MRNGATLISVFRTAPRVRLLEEVDFPGEGEVDLRDRRVEGDLWRPTKPARGEAERLVDKVVER